MKKSLIKILLVVLFLYPIHIEAYINTSTQNCFQKVSQRCINIVPMSLGRIKILYR